MVFRTTPSGGGGQISPSEDLSSYGCQKDEVVVVGGGGGEL